MVQMLIYVETFFFLNGLSRDIIDEIHGGGGGDGGSSELFHRNTVILILRTFTVSFVRFLLLILTFYDAFNYCLRPINISVHVVIDHYYGDRKASVSLHKTVFIQQRQT